MPGMGPPPKESRRRRNGDGLGATKVELAEEELETLRTIPDGEWHPEVVMWWECWSTCAQSQLFNRTDWMRLRTLIITRQSYQERPTPQKMAELRQTEGQWGATYLDRLRCRIKIDKPVEHEVPAVVKPLDDYRKRLAS